MAQIIFLLCALFIDYSNGIDYRIEVNGKLNTNFTERAKPTKIMYTLVWYVRTVPLKQAAVLSKIRLQRLSTACLLCYFFDWFSIFGYRFHNSYFINSSRGQRGVHDFCQFVWTFCANFSN